MVGGVRSSARIRAKPAISRAVFEESFDEDDEWTELVENRKKVKDRVTKSGSAKAKRSRKASDSVENTEPKSVTGEHLSSDRDDCVDFNKPSAWKPLKGKKRKIVADQSLENNKTVRTNSSRKNVVKKIGQNNGKQSSRESVKKRPAKRQVEAGEKVDKKSVVNVPEKTELSENEEEFMMNTVVMRRALKRVVKKGSEDGGASSSGSEDEWEEMEELNSVNGGQESRTADGQVEVSITNKKPVESEESKWAKFLRQQVNRKIRERQINCHKMHLLCYIAHLRKWMHSLIRSEVLSWLCLSVIPDGFINASEYRFDIATAERFMKWFCSAFQPAKTQYFMNSSCESQVDRLEKLIGDKAYEDDKDLASILFLCIHILKQDVRLCLSCQPIPHKSSMKSNVSVGDEDDGKKCETFAIELKSEAKISVNVKACSDSDDEFVSKSPKISKKSKGKPKTAKRNKTQLERNYWVELWEEELEQWITLDPWKGAVDSSEAVERDATSPVHYVLSIDNQMAIRDVTERYACKFLTPEVRNLRVDSDWWNQTLKLFKSRNRKRERLEDFTLRNYLLTKPKPVSIAEYKNHPLYVLKKDLLKYQAIYPEDQEPIGQIKGIDIYPRSSVFHLEGSLNWMKEARTIKTGEKPYKIVKGRPNCRVPAELREPKKLELFGYWQTVPYVPPKVENGRIPRNEFGNVYLYKSCMIPKGCVHVRLDGLVAVARKLDIDCVPAVVGWEFHKGGNHPILDGCVVLKKHEKALRNAWRKFYERKKLAAEKRLKDRAINNWRRLIKGALTLKRVRSRFLSFDHRPMNVDEKLEVSDENKPSGSDQPAPDDFALAWPQTQFHLPSSSKNDTP